MTSRFRIIILKIIKFKNKNNFRISINLPIDPDMTKGTNLHIVLNCISSFLKLNTYLEGWGTEQISTYTYSSTSWILKVVLTYNCYLVIFYKFLSINDLKNKKYFNRLIFLRCI